MQTKTKYEEMVLNEVRKMPRDALPQVVRMLRSFQEGISIVRSRAEKKTPDTGLCGIWQDDRSPDEIIEDIHAHRTGFGKRSRRII
ncbi:MAG: hypothetical protein HYS23_06245 [Geobacter sp.]|nr:hypothetical protein [Geobacter sp.]